MDLNNLKCPRCGGTLRAGFVVDHVQSAVPTVPTWLEGPPERSFWLGVKTSGRDKYPVMSYRCEGCGYLEAYAREAEKE